LLAGIGSRVVGWSGAGELSTEGHTLLCSFKLGYADWKVFEDLRTRDGVITFVSSSGDGRVLAKSADANFPEAKQVLDNNYSDFVDTKGMINMRGPETAQFGLTLSLLARYFQYTGDKALLAKHRAKIEATATILTALHDESLRLPTSDLGYGLIHGWNESDSCLSPKPETWWQPSFANSAFAARGLKDLAVFWKTQGQSATADGASS
jgi:hypothetical protein